ncbi:hypothetical protein D3H55_16135 [Bacillus salacetis]|uniref:Uncharacterized protein n=1 Tax=Bacillus salacetis TaxID=2315464 RepID=A0A3A1QY36_9BACI|nr:hypothetical protein D3H55_16135 [Bacillus salacetis]
MDFPSFTYFLRLILDELLFVNNKKSWSSALYLGVFHTKDAHHFGFLFAQVYKTILWMDVVNCV